MMKTISVALLCAAMLAPTCAHAACDAFLTLDGVGGEGPVGSPEPNLEAVPGTGGAWSYDTLTFDGVVPDKDPLVMASIAAAMQGTEKPHTVIITLQDPNGKVKGQLELDDAMLWKVTFPGTLSLRKAGVGLRVTYISPLPIKNSVTSSLDLNKIPSDISLSVAVPAVQDAAGTLGVSDFTVSFPGAVGQASSTGVVPSPTMGGVTFTSPSDVDDGWVEWLNSVIANEGDVRPVTFRYAEPNGAFMSLTVNMQAMATSFSIVRKRKKTETDSEQTAWPQSWSWGSSAPGT